MGQDKVGLGAAAVALDAELRRAQQAQALAREGSLRQRRGCGRQDARLANLASLGLGQPGMWRRYYTRRPVHGKPSCQLLEPAVRRGPDLLVLLRHSWSASAHQEL